MVVAVLAAGAVTPASAGFELTIDGTDTYEFNAPIFTLENLHPTADLTEFAFTIGDTAYGFDYLFPVGDPDSKLSTSANLTISTGEERPDADDDMTTDSFQLDFGSPLASSDTISWGADIDRDGQNTDEDFRSILFNNGADKDNAVATAYFGETGSVSLTLANDDDGLDDVYTYSAVVPLPAALPLFAGGLAGIAVVARRRRERAAA